MAKKQKINPNIISLFGVIEAEEEQKRNDELIGYSRDCLAYCRRYFKGEIYSDDIQQLFNEISIYPVVGVQSANSTGKTHSAARIIKWFIDTHSPLGTCEVYVSAAPPAENLNRVWSEFQRLEEKYASLFPKRNDGNKQWGKVMTEKYELTAKQFVKCIPIPNGADTDTVKEKFTGKHAEYMLFFLDESNSIDEAIWKAIAECMTSGIVVKLIFFYNPRKRTGPAYKRFHNGGCRPITISAFNQPNVIHGRIIIRGAVTRETVVKLTAGMTRLKMPEEVWDDELMFELPSFLVGERAMMDDGEYCAPLPAGPRVVEDQDYNNMVRGIPPKVSSVSLIPHDWIQEARARHDLYVSLNGNVPPTTFSKDLNAAIPQPSAMGFDVAETTDDNVTCNRWGGFLKFDAWTKCEIHESEERASETYKKLKAKWCGVDATGLGAGCAGHMVLKGCSGAFAVKVSKRPTTKARVEGHMGGMTIEHEFATLRDQIAWAVREWLRPGNGAMLPPEERLLNTLYALTYRKNPNSQKIEVSSTESLKAQLGHSPDHFFSLALTFAPRGGGWGVSVQRE